MRTRVPGNLIALVLWVLLCSCVTTPVAYDVLILDGTIVDGSL